VKKISAHLIFTNTYKPLNKGIVYIDDSGKIIKIQDTTGDLKDEADLEFYNGIICPGFINTHCHIELSELKDKIRKKTGLSTFISDVNNEKKQSSAHDLNYILSADLNMYNNGIVAVADISNSNLSLPVKNNSKIYYHTFYELLGLDRTKAEKIFSNYLELKAKNKNSSLTIHSLYSLSNELLQKFIEYINSLDNGIISVHNQESRDEIDYFKYNSGKLYEYLKNFDLSINKKSRCKEHPIIDFIKKIKSNINILLVHNTFSSEQDIIKLKKYNKKLFFVLCPKSNIYIEGNLPDINTLITSDMKICMGTDSLASNDTLSILEEIKTLQNNFPYIKIEELIKWATINGAEALQVDSRFGKIETGKSPGINLITNIDFTNYALTKDSQVIRIC